MNVCDIEYNLLLLVYKLHLSVNFQDFMTHFNKSLKTLSINTYHVVTTSSAIGSISLSTQPCNGLISAVQEENTKMSCLASSWHSKPMVSSVTLLKLSDCWHLRLIYQYVGILVSGWH